jgi:catechol 2,3-dioxygenase-like lactoylglutathione lyase family enzyme
MAKALALDHVQVAMPRGEEAAARSFYGVILGLPEIAKPPPLAARGGVWFQCVPQQLHLGVEDDFSPARKAHPAFVVDDLDEIQRALSASGSPVILDPVTLAGSRRLFTEDPFGNRVELTQPPAEAAK